MDVRGLSCALAIALVQGAAPPTPRPVAAIDFRQYAGTYYEIARLPNDLQRACAADVTATYTVRPDGRLEVVNQCRKGDGTLTESRGVARRVGDDKSGARLEIQSTRGWLPLAPRAWRDYWILGVGPDYSYVVAGDRLRRNLWILSRLPRMPGMAYQQALEIASSNGYDVDRLVKTPQRREWQ